MRILVAEDERDLNRIITKRLEKEGYSVDSCFDGEESLDFLAVGEYDAVLLDIMMPEMDGLSVVRSMRSQNNNTPVLFLTAKDSVQDKVTGLDAGAEDYLVKPFAFDELLARIRVMTRKKAGESTNILSVGDLTMDIGKHLVTRDGKEIELSAKEFAILEYMLMNKGIVLSREKIENHIWNFDYAGGSNVVDVYIRYLRRKIDDDFKKKLLHTIRGKGYVLKEETE
ncbi:MAG: response regulator transcription factor [Clostridia bacterium]|nr:response regulator transcription factor [Clostridia bacterium]